MTSHSVQPSKAAAGLRWLLLVLVGVLALRQWVWMPVVVTGTSMEPSLRPGTVIWVNKLAYRFDSPRRGDLVSIWTGKELALKRVLALPGEEASVSGGYFCVNGRPLAEPYVRLRDAHSKASPGRMRAGRFVVAGDNRRDGLMAVVSRDRIVGRVMWRDPKEGQSR